MWQAENMEEYFTELQRREHVEALITDVIENYFDGNYTKSQSVKKVANVLTKNEPQRSDNNGS